MKKWYRYLAAGVLVLLTLCVAGCGGVSHKSPEKVTEELIQSYTDGKEKKVKECYNQADNTEADLQAEITATLKYFAAHNPKKVSVQDCEILSENDKYSYVYITYNLILEDDQEYPCVGTYMVGKQDKTYYIMAPSQITDDMKTQAATAYVQFMKTDAYKTYTKAYETFICPSRIFKIVKFCNFLSEISLISMTIDCLQKLLKIMRSIPPNQMTIRISINKMHVDNIISKYIKPLINCFTGNSHCCGINHRFQIWMIYFIQHSFYIIYRSSKVGFLRAKRFHCQSDIFCFGIFCQNRQHFP